MSVGRPSGISPTFFSFDKNVVSFQPWLNILIFLPLFILKIFLYLFILKLYDFSVLECIEV